MNHYDIQKRILDVFAECSVFSFPVDCTSLLEHYGYTLHTYQELGRKNKALYEMCISYSEEAFRDGAHRIIAYNQDKSPLRIRFSLAHELGHHILGHKNETRHNEIEANFFAGNLLAPRMAIYYARCQNARDVSFIFQISEEAAQIAYEDYLRWHEELLLRERRMTALERDMYYHFYRAEQDCFVWNVKTCDFCGPHFTIPMRTIAGDVNFQKSVRCAQTRLHCQIFYFQTIWSGSAGWKRAGCPLYYKKDCALCAIAAREQTVTQ